MKIYTKPAGPMGANTYLLTEDDKTAVAIDCGGEEVWDYALSKGLKIEYVLLTHGHFDRGLSRARRKGREDRRGKKRTSALAIESKSRF